jgi:FkbM family methyltransferase
MLNIERIQKSLQDDPDLAGKFIKSLIILEKEMGYPQKNIRDTFSGLVADEVFKGMTFVKELENGLKIKFVYNSKIAREFLLSDPGVPNHVWEPQTTKVLQHFSKGAKNVIIGGAYFGDHALIIAEGIKGTGVCHTFEPNAVNCLLIEENAQLNNLSNLRINKQALWSRSGEKLTFEGEDALASTVPASDDAKNYIDTLSIDDYLNKNNIKEVQLLMIDVEGGEMKVLEGSVQMLKTYKPVVIFENHSLHNDWSNGLENSDSIRFMRDLGYKVYSIRDFHNNMDTTGMKVELSPVERTYTKGPPHGFNLLAITDEALIQNKMFRIVYDYSPKLLLHKSEKEFLPAGN